MVGAGCVGSTAASGCAWSAEQNDFRAFGSEDSTTHILWLTLAHTAAHHFFNSFQALAQRKKENDGWNRCSSSRSCALLCRQVGSLFFFFRLSLHALTLTSFSAIHRNSALHDPCSQLLVRPSQHTNMSSAHTRPAQSLLLLLRPTRLPHRPRLPRARPLLHPLVALTRKSARLWTRFRS